MLGSDQEVPRWDACTITTYTCDGLLATGGGYTGSPTIQNSSSEMAMSHNEHFLWSNTEVAGVLDCVPSYRGSQYHVYYQDVIQEVHNYSSCLFHQIVYEFEERPFEYSMTQ